MGWSFPIATLAGIRVYVHWTFLLLIGWFFAMHLVHGEGLGAALAGAGFILAAFGCVVLHELGHALAARRYHIETRDIILLPIGGVARLERMPEKPSQELVVALAGPAVNLVIAAILAPAVWALSGLAGMAPEMKFDGGFLRNLLWVNVLMVAFNLLPAFPMDGGRVLRALLAMRMDYARATQIAASFGQAIAILFAIAGLFGNFMLLFIALFVYLGAAGEAQVVQIRSLLGDVPVRDAMLTRFRALSADDTLQRAADELLAGSQQDFPVLDGGRFLGMLRRDDLVRGLNEAGPAAPVRGLVNPECHTVGERDLLRRVMEQLQGSNCGALPVLRSNELVGLVTLENVGELMMIRSALRGGDGLQAPSLRRA